MSNSTNKNGKNGAGRTGGINGSMFTGTGTGTLEAAGRTTGANDTTGGNGTNGTVTTVADTGTDLSRTGGNLNNGTTPPVVVSPPAVPTLAELAERRASLGTKGPYAHGTKPTTTVFLMYDGALHQGKIAGHPAPGDLVAFVNSAPAVTLSGPTGNPFTDPATQKPKRHKLGDVIPGADAAPFLADVVEADPAPVVTVS